MHAMGECNELNFIQLMDNKNLSIKHYMNKCILHLFTRKMGI